MCNRLEMKNHFTSLVEQAIKIRGIELQEKYGAFRRRTAETICRVSVQAQRFSED